MTSRFALSLSTVAAAAMILSTEQPAFAQDALGGGNALDRNTQVGSGGSNAPRPANPYAGRNSVITGEVIGGREFRGRVGYTAPGDFRGSLGSNDLYRFRAGSAWSSPTAFQLGYGTYEQLRFGQSLGVFELSRSGMGATPSQVFESSGPMNYSQLAESRVRLDNQLLTAASASRMATAFEPTTLVRATAADGRSMAIVSSSVRGLALEQYDQRWDSLGLTTYDQIRMREESAGRELPGLPQQPGQARPDEPAKPSAALSGDRIGMTFETRFDTLRSDSDAQGSARVETTDQADYARILRNIADRYAREGDRDVSVDPSILKQLHEQYQGLRDELTGRAANTAGDAGPRQTLDPTTGQPLPAQPGSTQGPTSSPTPGNVETRAPGEPGVQIQPGDSRPGTRPEADPLKPIDLSHIAPALQHGEKVERLSSEQQGRFNELMMAAEELLKSGEYLLAEQRFQRALRFSPGNPLAMAGAVNSQIGAGLYLPAGYTLRSMFSQHPEMIDATYAQSLMPSAERIAAALDVIKSRIESGNERGAHGLVLAYLGRQASDAAIIERGIAAIEAEKADDALAKLLRTVWLNLAPAPASTPEK